MSADLRDWAELALAGLPEHYSDAQRPLIEALLAHADELMGALSDRDAALAKAEADLEKIREDNQHLREAVAALSKALYGQSSEAGNRHHDTPAEPPLEESKASEDDPDPTPVRGDDPQTTRDPDQKSGPASTGEKRGKRGGKGRQRTTFPSNLPIDEVIFEIEGGCLKCGGDVDRIGSESRDFLVSTIRWRVRREIYHKQRCRCCRAIQQKPAPYRLVQGSRLDRTVWAELIVSKNDTGTPFYRAEDYSKQQGLTISRSRISGGSIGIAKDLSPLNDQLRQHVLDGKVIYVDETTLPVLNPGAGRTHRGYAWTYLRDERRWGSNVPPAAFFEYQPGRAGKYPHETLINSQAKILSLDGYDGYNKILATGRERASCNAHARRKFRDSLVIGYSQLADRIISLYAEAYTLERQTFGLSPAERERRRHTGVRPIFEEMEALLRAHDGRILGKSSLGGAIAYWLNHRDDLTRFLDDGHVEIDNNLVENAIRRLVLVRKNCLFAGSRDGAKAWAFYSSLVQTCRLNGVGPLAYFNWLFEKVENRHPVARYDELLPWHCSVGRL